MIWLSVDNGWSPTSSESSSVHYYQWLSVGRQARTTNTSSATAVLSWCNLALIRVLFRYLSLWVQVGSRQQLFWGMPQEIEAPTGVGCFLPSRLRVWGASWAPQRGPQSPRSKRILAFFEGHRPVCFEFVKQCFMSYLGVRPRFGAIALRPNVAPSLFLTSHARHWSKCFGGFQQCKNW